MTAGLRISVALNVVLLGALALVLGRDHRAVSPVDVRRAAMDLPKQPKPGAGLAVGQTHDGVLTADDVTELERKGVSRDIVVNVLLETLNRRSEARVRALQEKYAPKRVPEREYVELSRRSDAERVRELRAALGEDGYRAWDKEQTLRELNRARPGGVALTTAEAEQAYRLQKEFEEKNRELQMAMEDGVADRADVGALQAQAQQALDRELEKLLGQPRFAELRGHADPTTEVYRTYGDLNPTREQANAVLAAEREYHAREASLAQRLEEAPADAGAITAELKAMSEEQDEKLRRIFGPVSYDAMKRQNDATYQTLQLYAGAWALKADEIQPVYETLRAYRDQAERAHTAAELREASGQHVNWREIDAALTQARQQTESALQNLLGADRARRLTQNELLAP